MFAHAVDDGFKVQTNSRQFIVGGLGTERVGLPVEFLRQEIQLPTDNLTLSQQLPCSSNMGIQAVNFFPDIAFDGQNRSFLDNPVRISL